MQDLAFILLILIVIIDILVIIVTWRILSMYALQEDNLEVDPEDNEDNEIIMRVLSS